MEHLVTLGQSDIVIHLAYILTLAGYLVRDILLLRTLLVAASATMLIYFLAGMADPAWTPVAWQLVLILVNAVWVVVLLRERRGIRLSDEERELQETLFREFSALEVMKLLRAGEWVSLDAGDVLTRRGDPVEHLYLVNNGEVEVDRGPHLNGRRIRDGGLIGEMSFLKGVNASATVTATVPSRCLAWRQDRLRALLQRNPSMRGMVMSVIGSDLTHKLATPPEYAPEATPGSQPSP